MLEKQVKIFQRKEQDRTMLPAKWVDERHEKVHLRFRMVDKLH